VNLIGSNFTGTCILGLLVPKKLKYFVWESRSQSQTVAIQMQDLNYLSILVDS